MEKRGDGSLTLHQRSQILPTPNEGREPESSPSGDATRAQLIHSIYQLALDPQFYDTFLEQWDGHVDKVVSALHKLKGKAPLEDPELIAHFDRAFGILEKLGRNPPRELREGRGPRVLIGEDGTIIWRNGAAERAFELQLPASIEDISFYFVDPNLCTRLLSELPTEARVNPDAFHLLCAEIDDKPLFMLARAVHEQGSEMAILLEPLVGEWNSEVGTLLARGFGLTEAEIQVAAALAEGNTPAEIADQRAVSLSTVRSQIKSLLAKTGAASQTDLVRLLASLSRIVSPKDREDTARRTATYITPSRRHIPVEFHGASEGTPVLFLHGMLDGLTWSPCIDAEYRRHGLQVIAPARPSFGTATPHGGHPASAPAAFARDIEWLLDELNIGEVQLLGHMAGGFYAFALAAHLGNRVKRIVNVAAGVPILSTTQFTHMSRRQRLLAYTARTMPAVLPFVVRAGVRQLDSDGERTFMNAFYEASPADLAMLADPDVFRSVQRGYRFTISQGHRAFATDAYHIVRDWSEVAAASAVPVTLIHGRHDPVVKIDTVENFARKLGTRAELQVVEDCGQIVLLSAPETVCRALV